ncbi:hypothetical protein F4680DRAFT_467402 [Xylaria scruposa]|nr:hypothetical protein F4680DRAFT_467402 [Xylaria scruposa]
MDPSNELSRQWQNPRDILSLLLLVGSDIVQKAIAQLHAVYMEPAKGWPRIYLTPVGYAVTSLTSVIGDKRLMPANPDSHSIDINFDTGYARINRSWLLGRILRDHELAVEAYPGPEAAKLKDPQQRISLRIDIFEHKGESKLAIDHLVIPIIPWVLYGDWAVFLVAAAGTALALVTGSLRQWNIEKWPGRRLNPPEDLAESESDGSKAKSPLATVGPVPVMAESIPDMERGQSDRIAPDTAPPQPKSDSRSSRRRSKTEIVCLTRGNGHRHVQILIGSGSTWDLESLATATTDTLPETPWCLVALAILWVGLLISVSGLESYTWFLILVGGLGTLQNIYAASAPRRPESLGLRMRPFAERPTILGLPIDEKKLWLQPGTEELSDDEGVAPDDPLVREKPYLEPCQTAGVRGAIRELEKTILKAGIALMPEFFPAVWKLDRERYRDKKETRFWRWMYKRPGKEDREKFSAFPSPTRK